MSVTLPEVKAKTIDIVTLPTLNMNDMSVNSDKLKEYLNDITKTNPEIVKFMARSSKIITKAQQSDTDCAWFNLVSMIIMYKSLEQAYVQSVASTN